MLSKDRITEIKKFVIDNFSNAKDMLGYLRYSPYGRFCSTDDFQPFEKIKKAIGASWFKQGASKIVFGWNDVKDFVIKIPFMGEGEYDLDNNLLIVTEFMGASNQIEKFDYCLTEFNVYKDAIKEELNQFFCETVFICVYAGIKFYAAEKANPFDYDGYPIPSDDSYNKAMSTSSVEDLEMDNSTLGLFYDYYETDKVLQLVDFLCRMNLNDLHNKNVGFMNEKLVLLDYSGFND